MSDYLADYVAINDVGTELVFKEDDEERKNPEATIITDADGNTIARVPGTVTTPYLLALVGAANRAYRIGYRGGMKAMASTIWSPIAKILDLPTQG